MLKAHLRFRESFDNPRIAECVPFFNCYEFSDRFKDDKGEAKVPDALAALAYDATNILLQSIKEANSADPTKVKDAMAKITFTGVSGKITYDAQHNPVKAATILAVTPDGVKFDSIVNP